MEQKMMKQLNFASILLLGLLVPCLLMAPVQAGATDLHAAKQAGLIGEKPDGYLGLVRSAPADVRELVTRINRKRRAHYQEIAARNGTTLRQVELLAGKKAIRKTPSGYYIQTPSGQWRRKP